jgi:hypothetical protein
VVVALGRTKVISRFLTVSVQTCLKNRLNISVRIPVGFNVRTVRKITAPWRRQSSILILIPVDKEWLSGHG